MFFSISPRKPISVFIRTNNIAIKAIPDVQETHIIYGYYDIIAKFKTEKMQKLKDIYHQFKKSGDRIRSVPPY